MKRDSKTVAEVVTTTGVMHYPVVGSIYGPIINLEHHPITGEPLRFNRREERIEYQRPDGEWDVFISDSELLCVQIIHNFKEV